MDEQHLKQLIQARFGRDAHAYVVSRVHAEGPQLSRLVEIAAPRSGSLSLDVATGGGHTAIALAERGGTVVAADMTEPMLLAARAFARQRGVNNVKFVAGDAETLPFEDRTFDVVSCRFAAHHFLNAAKAFDEMARVLRPNGVLVVVDNVAPEDDELDSFVNEIEWLRDEPHVRSHRPSELREYLTAGGLTVFAEEHFPRYHDFASWVERANTPADRLERLIARIRQAPRHVQEAFDVRIGDQGIESWIAPQLLVAARRSE